MIRTSGSPTDVEKKHSGLTGGCAVAGRAGCKLVEFPGDGASRCDGKNSINDVHDVMRFFPEPDKSVNSPLDGSRIPVYVLGMTPASRKVSTISHHHRPHFVH